MKHFFSQFGGKVTSEWRSLYEQSSNWQNGRFQNLNKVDFNIGLNKLPGVIYRQLTTKTKAPKTSLPINPFDKEAFLALSDKAKIIWYGHSVVMLRLEGKTILIDPMLGNDTAPIAPFPTKRYSENTLSLIDDFPEIDLILLTHDHYDHLDFDSIQKLKMKTKKYIVALGVKRHLVKWGVKPELITEVDWWNELNFENIQITFTPTCHFSGRGLTDRAKTLWGGWVLKTAHENIWFSGDGGYGKHFEEIGKRLGPFDFGFMECGQYNEDWRPIHLFPDEAVLAALDAGVKKAMPVHWAGFTLSYQHDWDEPVEIFQKVAEEKGLDYILPQLGEVFNLDSERKTKWWQGL